MNLKTLKVFSLIFFLSGCAYFKPLPTILLDEDMIYTVKAGTVVDVWLGKKHIGHMSWRNNRKIVDASHIVRSQEIKDQKLLKNLA